jgi:hypothetical protein
LYYTLETPYMATNAEKQYCLLTLYWMAVLHSVHAVGFFKFSQGF